MCFLIDSYGCLPNSRILCRYIRLKLKNILKMFNSMKEKDASLHEIIEIFYLLSS